MSAGTIEEALNAMRRGVPVLIYDSSDRESEVDLVFYAGYIDSDKIFLLRTVAGGLICYATLESVTKALGIPFADELLSREGLGVLSSKRLRYGDRSAFTIWVNHISVDTGIRDKDRATTILELHKVAELVLSGKVEEARSKFYKEFQAPGHVPVLAARRLSIRRGHTELATHLALLAGLRPSVAFAEMLARGGALGYSEAKVLSERRGWPLVTGDQIIRACRNEEVCWSS